jgi:hypothetical protein
MENSVYFQKEFKSNIEEFKFEMKRSLEPK